MTQKQLLLSLCFLWAGLSACQFSSSLSLEARTLEPSPGIIGGETARASELPFIANIWMNNPRDQFVDHLCGGSLISPKWVLTAAHCLLEDVTEPRLGVHRASEIIVYVGGLQRKGADGRKVMAKRLLVHPRFAWPKYDMGLIELNESIPDIQPISLNEKALMDFSNLPVAAAAGWGLMDEQGKTEAQELRKVTVPLVSREECSKDPYLVKKNWIVEEDMICAKTQLGKKATCGGDSGGPLFWKTTEGWIQIGIVSWGSACNLSFLNNQADVEGYADVSAASAWIRSLVKDLK